MQALSRHPTAGPKQASQEQLSPDKEAVTYNQIILVKALVQQGVDWNALIVKAPGPVRGASQPQSETRFTPAPMRSPPQGGARGAFNQQPEEDDDVIPF